MGRRQRRRDLEKVDAWGILEDGSKKAQEAAKHTIERVRDAMHLSHSSPLSK